MDCGIPYCHNGCPVNNLIPDWNDLVYRGQWREALRSAALDQQFSGIHRARLPGALRGELHAQHPATIRSPSRPSNARSSIAAGKKAGSCLDPRRRKTGKKVAVVGSGPAGLACGAATGARRARVTVFEKNDRIGGLLRYGIPDFKMEKQQIDRRLAADAGRGRGIPHRRRSGRAPSGVGAAGGI